MGRNQAQIKLKPAEPVLIDLSGTKDPADTLVDKLPLIQSSEDIVLLIPACSVRTRRFALSVELMRPVANADLEELTETAMELSGEEKGAAVLYRQPACYILGHRVFSEPPIGQCDEQLTAEFLDLSISLKLAGQLDALVSQAGHHLVDIITPHELLSYSQDESEGDLLIDLGSEEMVVTATTEAGLAGAGSMPAGHRHFATDLFQAGLADKSDMTQLAHMALVDPQTADPKLLSVIDARLEEMAGFAHHVRSASHGDTGQRVILTGLDLSAHHAVDIFSAVLGSDVTLRESSSDLQRQRLAMEACDAPRRIALPPDYQLRSENAVLRWLRRHV